MCTAFIEICCPRMCLRNWYVFLLKLYTCVCVFVFVCVCECMCMCMCCTCQIKVLCCQLVTARPPVTPFVCKQQRVTSESDPPIASTDAAAASADNDSVAARPRALEHEALHQLERFDVRLCDTCSLTAFILKNYSASVALCK